MCEADERIARYRQAANAIPQIARGMAWCTTCGHWQRVDGWPTHCGHTMTIDSPEERAARKNT